MAVAILNACFYCFTRKRFQKFALIIVKSIGQNATLRVILNVLAETERYYFILFFFGQFEPEKGRKMFLSYLL